MARDTHHGHVVLGGRVDHRGHVLQRLGVRGLDLGEELGAGLGVRHAAHTYARVDTVDTVDTLDTFLDTLDNFDTVETTVDIADPSDNDCLPGAVCGINAVLAGCWSPEY